MAATHINIKLRPASETDISFLSTLYATTRTEEMLLVPWSDSQKQSFLDQQFEAQHQFYHQQFPDAEFHMVMKNNKPIGRLYVDQRKDEIRLIDIALMPEYRGEGIGSKLIKQVLRQARNQSKAVRIHVETNNPAIRMYRRLGFKQIDSNEIYHLMEWKDDRQINSS